MAFRALHAGMCAKQRHVGKPMIQGLFVEHDDLRVPPFMLHMAGLALDISNLRRASVKTAPVLNIPIDVFVAREAPGLLRTLVERLMAGAARRFELLMRA
jgi:hypothetical protein